MTGVPRSVPRRSPTAVVSVCSPPFVIALAYLGQAIVELDSGGAKISASVLVTFLRKRRAQVDFTGLERGLVVFLPSPMGKAEPDEGDESNGRFHFCGKIAWAELSWILNS
jgi:hypothetical protein